MARYDFECEECGHTFEIEERISEHDSEASPECPSCGSRETRQLPAEFFADTSDKS